MVFQAVAPASGEGPAKVQVAGVVEDPSAPRTVYDPKHPLADGQGYVTLPNVNVVEEMAIAAGYCAGLLRRASDSGGRGAAW